MPALLVALALAAPELAPPPLQMSGEAEVLSTLLPAAQVAWRELAAAAGGAGLPIPSRAWRLRLVRGLPDPLHGGLAGSSQPGLLALRPDASGSTPLSPTPALDPHLRESLRHELAHQLLFWACPAASGDRLFHEAFAMAASGELPSWVEGPYLGLPAAVRALRSGELDSRQGRRSLARLLDEGLRPGELWPAALTVRLRDCGAGPQWTASSPEELSELPLAGPDGAANDASILASADASILASADASIVLSRHSGEVLLSEGAARTLLPFGSTLKPFLVAGAGPLPTARLSPGNAPEWACGADLPPVLGVRDALPRSCNGWFLDWAPPEPLFGRYGPALLRLGLSRLPRDAAEAIGLRGTLRISPWGLAQAYRLLAEARPDLLAILEDTPRIGTLAGLPDSGRLAGVALKTGTVRDSANRPLLGWIAAVDRDLVAVRVRAGRMPRSFLPELLSLLTRARRLPGVAAARVQVLGLVPSGSVEVRCPGAGFSLGPDGPVALEQAFRPLAEAAAEGPALCLAAPWRVRFPEVQDGRDYAGLLERSPPGPGQAAPGAPSGDRARLARRGSDFLFRTTLLQYAAGVVAAEQAGLRGEARTALLRVVAHNESHSRHPGRPVCDTSHCQAFRGTAPPAPGDSRALALGPLPWDRWLPFSLGGGEPWVAERSAARLDSLLGPVTSLRFEAGRALYLRAEGEAGDRWEEQESVPCEAVRSPLRLPGCPERVERGESVVRFYGRGQGHGEGLDLVAAERSRKGQEELLREAYGR